MWKLLPKKEAADLVVPEKGILEIHLEKKEEVEETNLLPMILADLAENETVRKVHLEMPKDRNEGKDKKKPDSKIRLFLNS